MSNPNVFVLSADSLRLDRSLDDETMPYLAELGEQATRFTNTVANGPFTPASFPALLASRYASSIKGIGLPEEGGVTTLAEQMFQEGYRTALWSDNKFVGSEYNYSRGYEDGFGYRTSLRDTVREHIDESSLLFRALELGYMQMWKSLKNAAGDSHYYATAADLQAKARGWLEGLDPVRDDVHLWLHYMDTHHPYEPSKAYMPYEELEVVDNRTQANNLTRRVVESDGADVSEAERRDVVRLYDAECTALDAELRTFVGWLREEGWLGEEDILVLTSDHGEVLSNWDSWGVFGHENVFTEECTRVPLVIDHADLEPRDLEGQASLVDLMPTLLDLVGSDPPEELVMGESLVPMVRDGSDGLDRVFYDGTLGYHGVRASDGRKIFNCERHGEDEYLETNYANSPTTYDDEPVGDDVSPDLRADLEDHAARCAQLAEESQGIDPDSLQVEQHMRDLGYLE